MTTVRPRHPLLRFVAQGGYRLPGTKAIAGRLVRRGLSSRTLSLRNKQRLYNFFARDVSPAKVLRCETRLPAGAGSRSEVALSLDMRDELCRRWYYWGYGGYEVGTVRLLCKLLRGGGVVFDVGANVGYYTVLAAALVEGRGQVHAFEPLEEAFELLSENCRANSFAHVAVNRVALGDEDSEAVLHLPASRDWSNASLVEGFTEQEGGRVVDCARVDSYCVRKGVNGISLIRLDVEGAEIRVLRGMGDTIDAWSPDIICEVLPGSEPALEAFFDKRRYRKFLVRPDGLEEYSRLEAHPRFRDFYFSVKPIALERVQCR